MFLVYRHTPRLFSNPTVNLTVKYLSSSVPVFARKKKINAPPAISKKKMQAKERRRELKRIQKTQGAYEAEKMTLVDAIRTLRVSIPNIISLHFFHDFLFQAVDISHPNATYELVIKTMLGRGSVPPRGRLNLPYSPKPAREDKILVFADGRAAEAAKAAGADIVGGSDLIEGIITGRLQANVILATPAMIRTIAPRLGRVLGPKGLMPTERRGTVMEDPATYIRKLKGTTQWAGDKAGTIRSPIGKVHISSSASSGLI